MQVAFTLSKSGRQTRLEGDNGEPRPRRQRGHDARSRFRVCGDIPSRRNGIRLARQWSQSGHCSSADPHPGTSHRHADHERTPDAHHRRGRLLRQGCCPARRRHGRDHLQYEHQRPDRFDAARPPRNREAHWSKRHRRTGPHPTAEQCQRGTSVGLGKGGSGSRAVRYKRRRLGPAHGESLDQCRAQGEIFTCFVMLN